MSEPRSPIAILTANRGGDVVGLYGSAYLDAAVGIFERGMTGRNVDLCFYPGALCLRHGLELVVKQVSEFIAYELRDPAMLYDRGHSLSNAWKRVPADFLQGSITEHEAAEALRVVSKLVAKLDAIDPTGMLFRYPEDARWLKKTERTGDPAVDRPRANTDVPYDQIDLREWHADAQDALHAAQTLNYDLGERTAFLRDKRGDPPARSLADLVTGKITEQERAAYRQQVGWRPSHPVGPEIPRTPDPDADKGGDEPVPAEE